MPKFLHIQVTNICTVALENIDGSININPSVGTEAGQLIKFHLMDCMGRRFRYYKFKDVEYRATVTDSNIATAKLANKR